MSTTVPGGAYSTSTGITTPVVAATKAQGAGNDQVFSSSLGSSATPTNTTTTTQKNGTTLYTGPDGNTVAVVAQDSINPKKVFSQSIKGDGGAILDTSNPVKLTAGGGDNNVNVTGDGKATIRVGGGDDNVNLTTVGNVNQNIGLGSGYNQLSLSSQTNGKVVVTDFNKKDSLQIADRTGDGIVNTLDFDISKKGNGTLVTLPNLIGGGETQVVLQNVNNTKITFQNGLLVIQ